MNTVTKDIAERLHAARATLGLLGIPTAEQLETDWGVYHNANPDAPGRCVAILSSAPPPPVTTLDKSNPVEETPVQIRVRGDDAESTFQLADKIARHLYALAAFDVVTGAQTVNYLGILHGGGIMSLGWDARRRYTHVVNLRAHRRLTAG